MWRLCLRRLVENSLTALLGRKGARKKREFVRFLGAGCLNPSVCFAVYCFGILLGLNYVAANSIAWIFGVVVGFVLNSRFVFRKPYGHIRFLTFLCSNILNLVVSIALLTLLIKVFLVNAI